MEKLIDSLFYIHVIAGTASLIMFWIPVFAQKRKGLHTAIGKWYVYCMWAVVITAFLLSVKNFAIGRYNLAFLLGFLSLVTANPLWYAIGVMKSKKTYTGTFLLTYLILHIAIVLLGGSLLVYGLFFVETSAKYLMIIFGSLAVLDIRELLRVREMKSSQPDWYKVHYSGMITTGIAAYTAFFAFGGSRFLANILTNEWQLIPWTLPTVIGILSIRIMNHRRKRKLSLA
tara:strand:- start:181066 stop:181752 length:687 start_codon:yes stop_codon:yes gene_type:complete